MWEEFFSKYQYIISISLVIFLLGVTTQTTYAESPGDPWWLPAVAWSGIVMLSLITLFVSRKIIHRITGLEKLNRKYNLINFGIAIASFFLVFFTILYAPSIL